MNKLLERVLALPHGDKIAHAGAGFFAGAFGAVVAGSWGAFAIVTVVAVGKELYDLPRKESHTAEGADALATLAGGAVALLAYWGVVWLF